MTCSHVCGNSPTIVPAHQHHISLFHVVHYSYYSSYSGSAFTVHSSSSVRSLIDFSHFNIKRSCEVCNLRRSCRQGGSPAQPGNPACRIRRPL